MRALVRLADSLFALTVAFSLALGVSPAQAQTHDSVAHQEFLNKLVAAAVERAQHTVRYDPAYVKIPYPGGDVPADTGVCTDEVIRTYRAVGIDLQQLVHEDKAQNFSAYPTFGARRPDTNIDHRRVPNLMVFFSRKGESLSITENASDYSPGDLVTWDLGGNVPHIGIVVDQSEPGTDRHLILHNIGRGPKMEDALFVWKITGHYRYFGPPPSLPAHSTRLRDLPAEKSRPRAGRAKRIAKGAKLRKKNQASAAFPLNRAAEPNSSSMRSN